MGKKSAHTIESLKAEEQSLRERIDRLQTIEAEYKTALKKLAEKEAFNFALFQYNPLLTVVVDRQGRVIKSNKAKIASGDRLPNIGDIMYRDYASRHEVNMYEKMMECITTNTTGFFPELWYGNKALAITISPFPGGAIITSQDITEQKIAEHDRLKLIEKLQQALGELETLRGLLPICACCKKIRDDQGYWNHIESYLRKHTLADFTHTLCPECVRQYYPDLWKKMEAGSGTGIKGQ
ncbi:MAG: hypothetical protein JW768_15275 [Chitinispirillaceae bacterium]|nr:hypothetical protein [Chitinispirillaceae bacterium]